VAIWSRVAWLAAVAALVCPTTATPRQAAALEQRSDGRFEARVGGFLVLEAPAEHGGELRTLARGAEEVLPHLEADLGVRLHRPFRLLLLPPPAKQSRVEKRIDSLAPAWAAGFVLGGDRLGAIRLDRVDRYPYRDALSVLTHEICHVLLDDAVGDALPSWFEEGVATWLGRRWGLRDTLVLSSSLLLGELPELDRLDGYFRGSSARARVAYAASFDFVQWSVDRYGNEVVAHVVRLVRNRPFEEAWEVATGEALSSAEARWRRGSLLVYRWLPLVTGSGVLWIAITLLAVVAGIRRRRRSRQMLESWEEEERTGDDYGPVN
jgi:hypothetical protein